MGATQSRQHQRVEYHAYLELKALGSTAPIFGQSINVSQGGIFVAASDLIRVGAELSFRLPLLPEDEPLRGRVAWVRSRAAGRSKPRGMGISFVDLTTVGERQLRHFIDHNTYREELAGPSVDTARGTSSAVTPLAASAHEVEAADAAEREREFTEGGVTDPEDAFPLVIERAQAEVIWPAGAKPVEYRPQHALADRLEVSGEIIGSKRLARPGHEEPTVEVEYADGKTQRTPHPRYRPRWSWQQKSAVVGAALGGAAVTCLAFLLIGSPNSAPEPVVDNWLANATPQFSADAGAPQTPASAGPTQRAPDAGEALVPVKSDKPPAQPRSARSSIAVATPTDPTGSGDLPAEQPNAQRQRVTPTPGLTLGFGRSDLEVRLRLGRVQPFELYPLAHPRGIGVRMPHGTTPVAVGSYLVRRSGIGSVLVRKGPRGVRLLTFFRFGKLPVARARVVDKELVLTLRYAPPAP
ncbi:MAG: PilZ domain-containing protein [Deltaproteobacteria bacterium]|nr:PilZ domain-containing protein [Deltaproteobacteria bacterium]